MGAMCKKTSQNLIIIIIIIQAQNMCIVPIELKVVW